MKGLTSPIIADEPRMYQCKLTDKQGLIKVFWIKKECAVRGKLLEIKSNGSEGWTSGWKVQDVLDLGLNSAHVQKHRDDWREARIVKK